MATDTSLSTAKTRAHAATPRRRLALLLCSVFAFLLLGYHPNAEDGGIYASALSLRLHPFLFPAYRDFAVAHTGKSLFLPALAEVVRASHLPQSAVLLLLSFAAIAATVLASERLARHLFQTTRTQIFAVLLFSAALGMPVAGTALYLADPYLTARSFSTPLILAALTDILQNRWGRAAGWFALGFALHPLMTVWALLLAGFLLIQQRSSRPALHATALGSFALLSMAILQWLLPAEPAEVRAASLTRGYWFLSQWQWFEWIGLAGPLLLLFLFAVRMRPADRFLPESKTLANAACASIVTVWLASLLLIHTGNPNFFLARTQPLRLLHTTTAIFILLLGGWIAEACHTRQRQWIPAAVLVAAAVSLTAMQRSTYPASGFWELPGDATSNGYVNAFRWIRDNTPPDAVLAADAHYTTAPGEDAQMIRAIALRSSVPDTAKDGGIASVVPALAAVWQSGSQAQEHIDTGTDQERIQRLKDTGATWILLPAAAGTGFSCPYRNATAKVCRIR